MAFSPPVQALLPADATWPAVGTAIVIDMPSASTDVTMVVIGLETSDVSPGLITWQRAEVICNQWHNMKPVIYFYPDDLCRCSEKQSTTFLASKLPVPLPDKRCPSEYYNVLIELTFYKEFS